MAIPRRCPWQQLAVSGWAYRCIRPRKYWSESFFKRFSARATDWAERFISHYSWLNCLYWLSLCMIARVILSEWLASHNRNIVIGKTQRPASILCFTLDLTFYKAEVSIYLWPFYKIKKKCRPRIHQRIAYQSHCPNCSCVNIRKASFPPLWLTLR